MNILNITPSSNKLHRDRDMTLEDMKRNEQDGTITAPLKKNESLTVVFEWLETSAGASLAYSWLLKEPKKTEQEIILYLKQNEGETIGDAITVYDDYVGSEGCIY
eukprot:CAMPEP_0116920062 /NCGR_PEP_ID=MMETSP0467-20121206/20779_1 /TAXON_ID=283647 /ORGANISM="Mesodinium pulex, Strain SPMC105" /LENGTH=104 /DNA_ID=CAMNT_0004597803 /DNA_START=1510 /DNA_END=1824 /DNA_ORIENTATION=+